VAQYWRRLHDGELRIIGVTKSMMRWAGYVAGTGEMGSANVIFGRKI
jgi:hypothetical protein